jgi:hypothetical protein
MSLATLSRDRVSVIEAANVTVIQFPATEVALSALVKHQRVAVGARPLHDPVPERRR